MRAFAIVATVLACYGIGAGRIAAQDRPDVGAMWASNGAKASKPAPSKPESAKPEAAKPAKAPVAPAKKPEPAAPSAVSDAQLTDRLQALEAVAREQAQAIALLTAQLSAARKADSIAKAAPAPAPAPAPAAKPEAAKAPEKPADKSGIKPTPALPTVESLYSAVDSLKRELGAVDKRAQQRVGGLGNFRFSGDVRLRYEPTIQGGGFVTRHRERTRARLHITGTAGSEFSGGISITTGAAEEPQTENQTLSGFFTRKAIAFERFYVTYKPKWFRDLTLTAGKFPGTWARTGLTFSPDLHPEGVSALFHLPVKSATAPDLSVVAFWLPLLEVAGGSDSYIAGGQVQTKWSPSPRTKVIAHAAILDVTGADAIAVAVANGAVKQAQPQANTLRTDAAGKVVGFGTSFHLIDGIVGIEHTFSPKWPVALQLDVAHNTRAAKGESLGWFAEARAGAASAPGQTLFSLTYFRIERDAVVGAWNASDLRLNTNSVGQIFAITHRIRPDVSAGFTGWFGRVLDPTKTPSLVAPKFQTACKTAPYEGCRDPRMTRMQFDLTYIF